MAQPTFTLTCDCDYVAAAPTLEEAKQELERHIRRVHEQYEPDNDLSDSRRK